MEWKNVHPAGFEGSEKKLEVLVSLESKKGSKVAGIPSLRTLPRSFWDSVVAASGAQILSELSTLYCDAFLLSESSLFVFQDRIIMITCGQTRLIEAVPRLIDRLGEGAITGVFYERKNEAYPEAQHTRFEEDVARLKGFFQGGQTQSLEYPALGGYVRLFHWGLMAPKKEAARTLELLMHDLDPAVLKVFQNNDRAPRQKLSQTLQFPQIFSGFQFDEFWFEPCGYSLNALRGEEYYTLHLTPETHASYVSFETNRAFQSAAEFRRAIERVLKVFKPKSSLLIQFGHVEAPPVWVEASWGEFEVSPTQTLSLEPGMKLHFNAIGRNPHLVLPTMAAQWRSHRSGADALSNSTLE